jgi:hypothetical protein
VQVSPEDASAINGLDLQFGFIMRISLQARPTTLSSMLISGIVSQHIREPGSNVSKYLFTKIFKYVFGFSPHILFSLLRNFYVFLYKIDISLERMCYLCTTTWTNRSQLILSIYSASFRGGETMV